MIEFRTSRKYVAGILLSFLGGIAMADIEHRYTVIVDDALETLQVEARFSQPILSVTARARDAGHLLSHVEDCEANARLRMRNRRMMLPTDGIKCLNYTVDLARAAREERRNLYLAEDNVLVSPARWLWRPELTASTALRIRFVLPDNVQVAVPWQAIDDTPNEFLLGPSPESANAPALFGSFDYHEIAVEGAVLRASIPRSDPPLNTDDILKWLSATATDVTLTYGRFPNPSPQIIVMPIGGNRWSSDSAVPFGRVIRDGGEVIELFVNQDKPIDRFLDDWTATHEFSHLMLPYVGSQHKWISEGFAQYYQNVLLARSGAYSQEMAWEKIHAGLLRGRSSRPELSPNEAASRGIRGARMKVYWSGAAIALLADVTLRERSGGEESLDDVLDQLQSCCLPSDRAWTGPELFTTLDSMLDEPLFMPLYRRYADTVGFPDTSDTFRRLGIDVRDGKARFRRSAELADVRRAITALDMETAAWRQSLAAQ